MTDEQIKQNAEEYALNKTLISTDSFHGMVESHLAGAHSRDEEVEMLQNQIEELSEQLKMNAENIQKLRNPWISVEDRLPPRDVALIFPTHSIPVIGMIGNSTDTIHTGMRYDYSSKEWCYGFTPMRKYGANKDDLLISGDTLPVTHWMPIPKITKGE